MYIYIYIHMYIYIYIYIPGTAPQAGARQVGRSCTADTRALNTIVVIVIIIVLVQ